MITSARKWWAPSIAMPRFPKFVVVATVPQNSGKNSESTREVHFRYRIGFECVGYVVRVILSLPSGQFWWFSTSISKSRIINSSESTTIVQTSENVAQEVGI